MLVDNLQILTMDELKSIDDEIKDCNLQISLLTRTLSALKQRKRDKRRKIIKTLPDICQTFYWDNRISTRDCINQQLFDYVINIAEMIDADLIPDEQLTHRYLRHAWGYMQNWCMSIDREAHTFCMDYNKYIRSKK